jgi:hypothetical protein
MTTKFNKGETVEIKWKATTANTTEEASKIKAQLEKQGYSVTIEEKFYNGSFIWFNISGEMKKQRDPEWIRRGGTPIGDECGFSYGR